MYITVLRACPDTGQQTQYRAFPPILTSLLFPESRDKVVKIPCNHKALVTRKLVTPAMLN